MTFDTLGAADALAALVDAIDGVRHVGFGAPKSNTYDVQAWLVATAGQYPRQASGGAITREQQLTVVFGYRTGGDADAAERVLMRVNDDFPRVIYGHRGLGGLAGRLDLDGNLAGTAAYAEYAAVEYRVFPQIVAFTQTETIPQAG